MDGADILAGLEESIAYANASRSEIEIKCNADAVKTISPQIGIYSNKLKPTDKLPISLEEDSEYQFIKWTTNHPECLEFFDETSPSTIARVTDTSVSQISIEPQFEHRPSVTFLPSNVIEVPKNTAVEISFSMPMELTQNDLERISIEIDGLSVLENFMPPVLSEDKKSVVFTANRDKLIQVGIGTKKVVVTVPSDFYCLSGENKIYLNNDVIYSYRIDDSTNDKLNIRFSCEALQGKLSRVNQEEFYLENEQEVTFEPASEYELIGWNVKFTDGTDVPQNILFTEISEDLKTINVRVCDGSDKSVEISPITTLRPTVSFLPSNLLEVEKNTPIVISFSKPINFTKEVLDSIKIEMDSVDVRSCFEAPKISADKKQVTFSANRNKLLDVSSGTKTVVISVPKTTAMEENGRKITLASDAIYGYRVNNKTIDNVEIDLSCSSVQGVLSNSGINKYYLDNEITTVFTENERYQITNWSILSEENENIPETIIKREISEDKKTIKLTVLDAMSGIIKVRPVCYERPQILFSPDGSQIVEKNSSILVNFSEPMELIDEDLKRISIISEGEDVVKNFKTPTLSEEKTQITFEADFANLIELETGMRSVTVTIPGDFSYVADDEAKSLIYLGKDKSFTYRINPQTSEKMNVTMKIQNSNFGSLNINGNLELSIGQSQNIICNVSSDYAFIEWKVYDQSGKRVSKDEYSRFITFDEKSSDTTILVNRLSESKYTIEPECIIRPKIVSSAPLYDTNGVYRDRRVMVMFDSEMNESSIYYTEDEAKSLEEKGYTVLRDSTKNNKCYGYWDGKDKNTYVYKNIKITNRKLKDANFLVNYDPPYFDEKDKSILRIDAKTGVDAPPAVTDILVTICKEMTCKDIVSNEDVSLATDYSWAYYTNSRIDSDEPYFVTEGTGDDEFKLQFTGDNQIGYIKDNRKFPTSSKLFETKEQGFTKQNYVVNNLKNKQIWVSGMFSDGGSGPALLKWELYKVNSDYYQEDEENTKILIEGGQIDDLEITGANATVMSKNNEGDDVFGTRLDLKSKLKEGTYRIDFIAYDRNGRTTKKSFYFVHDVSTESYISEESIKNSRTTASEETITWGSSTNFDFGYVQVERWFDGTEPLEKFDNDETTKVESHTFNNLENQKKYEYRFYTVDIYGNKSEDYVSWKDEVRPSALVTKGTITNSRTSGEAETVSWKNPTETGSDEVDHVIIRCVDKAGNKVGEFVQDDTNTLTNTFTNLTNQMKYEYRFYSVDYSGNESSNYTTYKDEIGPTSGVSGVYTGSKKNSIEYFFDTPSDLDYDHVEIVNGSTIINNAINTKSKHNKVSYNFGTDNKEYTVNIYTVDYSGNRSEPVTVTEKTGVRKGSICYYNTTDGLFCSDNYYESLTPIGVVWCNGKNNKDEREKTRIVDLSYDSTGRFVVNNTISGIGGTWDNDWSADGKKNYDRIINFCNGKNTKGTEAGLIEQLDYYSPVHSYLYTTKNTANCPVTWYVPAVDEYLALWRSYFGTNYINTVNSVMKKLHDNEKASISYVNCTYQCVCSTITNNGYSQTTVYTSDKYWYTFDNKGDLADFSTGHLYMAQIDMGY